MKNDANLAITQVILQRSCSCDHHEKQQRSEYQCAKQS